MNHHSSVLGWNPSLESNRGVFTWHKKEGELEFGSVNSAVHSLRDG
jgi:hypothetical protein